MAEVARLTQRLIAFGETRRALGTDEFLNQFVDAQTAIISVAITNGDIDASASTNWLKERLAGEVLEIGIMHPALPDLLVGLVAFGPLKIDPSRESQMSRKMNHKLQENDPASGHFLQLIILLQAQKQSADNGFGVLNGELL